MAEQIKILLVDDDKPSIESIRNVLEEFGFVCQVAQSGLEAIEVFKDINPDVVVSDFRMPDLDGIELMTRLYTLKESTYVVLITGYLDSEVENKARERGAYEVFSKPLETFRFLTMMTDIENKIVSNRKQLA